jgi:hypothetical protein
MQSQTFPFRPSLSMIDLMKFVTPHGLDAGDKSYELDKAWFKAHKHRQQMIRKARLNDFATWECIQTCASMGWPTPPQLWVMVLRSGVENFIVIPLYMGTEQRWPVNNSTVDHFDMCESDGALQLVLNDIAHNKGFDQFEMVEWNRKVREALLASTQRASAVN